MPVGGASDAGVNFFDNAEAYAGGESERVMGAAFAELGWKRHEYVVSTKLFWGLHDTVNMRNTLNRKYLAQAIDGSLERFGLDFVDLVYCHRADPQTPIEETVWAMSDMVSSGKALYWGTSEWTADEIRAAYDDRRAPPPPQAPDGAARVQHPAPRPRREGVRPPLRGHRPGHDDLVAAGVGAARPASTSTACPRGRARRCRATSGCATC